MLFTPINIKNTSLKNRVIMPAINLGYSLDGSVNERLINFYEARAQGGAGLIMIGGVAIEANEVWGGFLSLHDDDLIAGHRELVNTLKKHNTTVGTQLFHAGRYSFAFANNHPIKAPSAIPSPISKQMPKELTIPEIKTIINNFGQAASRAKKAGYEVIEVIASAGYLINQFYSPVTNKRTDEYGGSLANRMKFGLEVIKEIRQQVGAEMVLSIRLGGQDFVAAGNTWREMAQFAVELEKVSLDMINVTGGWHEANIPQIQAEVPRGTYSYLAAKIKAAVNIPIVASNRINNPVTAESILNSKQADLVSVCRGFLADPDWAIKAEMGKANSIRKCIGCSVCLDMLFDSKTDTYGVGCAINPQAGREGERQITKTSQPLNILIIGAGPAGLEAARVAALKGHQVSIVEKSPTIGGQWNIASIPPGKAEFASLLDYYENIIKDLDIRLHLNTSADVELITKLNPDQILLATGAKTKKAPFPIAPEANVVEAWDILNGETPMGEEVLVIGGGSVGVETALYIAELGTLSAESLKFLMLHEAEDYETLYKLISQGSFKVTLVEMDKHLATDMGRAMRWTVMKHLKTLAINTQTETIVKEISAKGVRVEQQGEERIIPADTVVLSVGSLAENTLYEELKQKFNNVELIGDALKPAKVMDAIHQAFILANKL